MSKVKKYFWNLLIGIDQLANTFAGGDPDETVSSRIGKIKRSHGGKIPWRHPFAKWLDMALETVDKGHSMDSIDDTEGNDQLFYDCVVGKCPRCGTVRGQTFEPVAKQKKSTKRWCPFCGKVLKEVVSSSMPGLRH